jgi:2-hydroxychromene-2-carboxylate isomerase
VSSDSHAAILSEAGIEDAALRTAIVSAAKSDARVKRLLTARTDAAIAEGAFGAPTIVVHQPGGRKDMFFGSDRLELIAFTIKKPWHGPNPSPATQANAKQQRSKL